MYFSSTTSGAKTFLSTFCDFKNYFKFKIKNFWQWKIFSIYLHHKLLFQLSIIFYLIFFLIYLTDIRFLDFVPLFKFDSLFLLLFFFFLLLQNFLMFFRFHMYTVLKSIYKYFATNFTFKSFIFSLRGVVQNRKRIDRRLYVFQQRIQDAFSYVVDFLLPFGYVCSVQAVQRRRLKQIL